MQIEDLKIWVDLVNLQSFSQCAKLNFLTQPAITQKIKRLQGTLDLPLFTKGPKKLQVTPAGKILYEESQKIISEYQNLLSRIKSLSGELHGNLRIAAIYSIGLYELNDCVKCFLKKYPGVQLEVEFCHAGAIYQSVEEGKIDIGFVAYPKDRPRLKILPYKEDHLVLVVHPKHPLGRFRNIDIRKINGCDFIGFKEEIPTREALEEIFERYQIQVKAKIEFDNLEMIKRAVEAGSGVSILPSETIRQEREHHLLKAIKFSNEIFPRPLAMIIKKDRPVIPALQTFIDEISSFKFKL